MLSNFEINRKKKLTLGTARGVDGRWGETMKSLGTTITTEASLSSRPSSSAAGEGRRELAALRAARCAALLAIGSIMRPSIPDLFIFGFFEGPAVERGRSGICLKRKKLTIKHKYKKFMCTRATRLGFLGPIHHPGPSRTSLRYFDRRLGTRKPHRRSSTLCPATRYGSRNKSKYERLSATILLLNSPSRRYTQ